MQYPLAALLLSGLSVMLYYTSVQAAAANEQGPSGAVVVSIRNVLGAGLSGEVELRGPRDYKARFAVAEGRGEGRARLGRTTAYVYAYDRGIPILVDIREVDVAANGTPAIEVEVLEGSAGNRPLSAFDTDFDLVLDRLETRVGTDPKDANSLPGETVYEWPSPVLGKESRWYRGELHAHSTYGIGKQSVRELVRRAERLGLDFLAITDRNTLDAALDPEFKSNSVVLIPAMEWGNVDKGVALVYAPGVFPPPTDRISVAQALMLRVQAQGGVFAIAHPCFGTAPWQWGLSWANAIEVWCRGWNTPPPLWWDRLGEDVKERKDGQLIHSIAIATATPGQSANGQAALFWDLETTRGLKASVIAGSYTVDSRSPMGSPVTYVFAREKSLKGILEGLRMGRTFVSKDLKGPVINLTADMMDDGTIELGIGQYAPLNVPIRFFVEVQHAKGKRLEVLLNGRPFRSQPINSDAWTYSFLRVPESYSVYRARVVERAKPGSHGVVDVLAMTSPIYAVEIIPVAPGQEGNLWIEIPSEYVDPSTREPLPAGQELPIRWRM